MEPEPLPSEMEEKEKTRRQWHPWAGHLLNLMLAPYFKMEPEEAVSILPRQVDFVLEKRDDAKQPFDGLWSRLRTLNPMELVGPTNEAEPLDLVRFMSVCSGIVYKRNLARRSKNQPEYGLRDVAFWFFAPRFGDKFKEHAKAREPLVFEPSGIWATKCYGYRTYLVEYHELLDFESDSVPFHLLRKPGDHPPKKVIELIAKDPELRRLYGALAALFFPELWKKVGQMPDLMPPGWQEWSGTNVATIIKSLDPHDVLNAMGLQQVIQTAGLDQLIKTAGLNQLIQSAGLNHLIQTAGLDRVIQAAGSEQVVNALLSQMTSEQQEQLRQRLEKKTP